ncbi:MAG: hypothetical protein P4L90_23055 [Rhodopila sp.]|nr:hypothetical protein [Rhodopila sp.]
MVPSPPAAQSNDIDRIRKLVEEIKEKIEEVPRNTEEEGNAAEQRPAAFQFSIQGPTIDLLAEPLEAQDPDFARDTYKELLAKARDLRERLRKTNSADRAGKSIDRLLAALTGGFDALRPGVLLSRLRSIEADRKAFGTVEARNELFADAFAMIDDMLETARDLVSVFPIVRRIEAERLALDLDRNAEALPLIRQQIAMIAEAAETSGRASRAALEALSQNDLAIEEATDPLLRTSLVADTLLVVRNFAGAVAKKVTVELAELGNRTWQSVKDQLPEGVGLVARVAPFMFLTSAIAGPAGTIALALAAFKPLAALLNRMNGSGLQKTSNAQGQIRGNYGSPAQDKISHNDQKGAR